MHTLNDTKKRTSLGEHRPLWTNDHNIRAEVELFAIHLSHGRNPGLPLTGGPTPILTNNFTNISLLNKIKQLLS